MYKFIHRIFGFYVLLVAEADAVRLLNLLTEKRLLFWRPEHCERGLRLRCSLFTMEWIRLAAARAEIPLTVERAVGVPFIVYKYRHRLGLVLGSFIGLIIIVMSSFVVWEIEVTGNTNVETARILQALDEHALRVGTFIPTFNVRKAELDFILSFDEISSISINIKGNYAYVDVIERRTPPPFDDTSGIYDVVASEDGVITSVEAIRGSPMFKAGDVVLKGETLISAFSTGIYEPIRACHAKGSVYALVYRNFTVQIPFDYTERVATGRTESKTELSVLGQAFTLYLDEKPSFEAYDAQVDEHNVILFGFLKLPVQKRTVVYSEYTRQVRRIDEEEALGYATLAMDNWLSALDGTLQSVEYTWKRDDEREAYVLTAEARIEKNIAVEKELDLSDGIPELDG